MGSWEQPSEAATSFLAILPEESLERLRGLAKPIRLATGDWLFHELRLHRPVRLRARRE